MTQYILFIHGNMKSDSSPEEWDAFFTAARQSGLFKGGSTIGTREILGDASSAKTSGHIRGYMRVDSDDKQQLLALLEKHPVVVHGGSLELCEMPKS